MASIFAETLPDAFVDRQGAVEKHKRADRRRGEGDYEQRGLDSEFPHGD